MLWRTHLFAGVNTLWLLRLVPEVVTPNRFPVLVTCAAFGALLPDLDASASKIRSLSLFGMRPFSPLGDVVHRRWGHRGFLHSPPALLWFGAFLLPLAPFWSLPYALTLWLGFASHLAMDALTPSGIPLWRDRRKLHLLPPRLRIVTGSDLEEIVLIVLLLLTFLLLVTLL